MMIRWYVNHQLRKAKRERQRLRREELLELASDDPEAYERKRAIRADLDSGATKLYSVLSLVCGLLAVPLVWSEHPTGRWIAAASAPIGFCCGRIHMQWIERNPDRLLLEGEDADWASTPFSIAFVVAIGFFVYGAYTRFF